MRVFDLSCIEEHNYQTCINCCHKRELNKSKLDQNEKLNIQ